MSSCLSRVQMCVWLFAGVGLAAYGTVGAVLEIPVGARTGGDAPYIFEKRGAQARPDARFVDAAGRLTYVFRTRDVNRMVFTLRLANNFRVLVSRDGRHWNERLNAMRLFGRDRRDGEIGTYRVDVSGLLPSDCIYLRFLDASPLDGWGAYIAGIRIDSDAPPDHDWRWRPARPEYPGGIPEWALLGPFPADDPQALLRSARTGVQTPPERLMPPRGGKWCTVRASSHGRVDLLRLNFRLEPSEHCAVFAHVFLYSERVQDGRLLLGSDDAVAVWWNGALLLEHEVRRGCRDAQEDVPVRLGRGWNRLLIEVANGEGDWGFIVRLVDRDGSRPLNVRIQTDNPLPDADPFPTAVPRPDVVLLSAEVDPGKVTVTDAGLRVPLRVRFRNCGGPLRDAPRVELQRGDGAEKETIVAWPSAPVPAGLSERVLPLDNALWKQRLLTDGPEFFIVFGEQRMPLELPAFPRLLGGFAESPADRLPANVVAGLRILAEAQRWWNAFDLDAEEQRAAPRRWFKAVLDGKWSWLCSEAADLQSRRISPDWTTTVQCGAPYGETFDVQSDAVLVYGLANTARRTIAWRRQGYRTQLMTGIAWGGYQDYLYGRFDGKRHLDDAQMNRRGERISHGGDVYYMAPTLEYTEYLCRFIERSLDLPLDGICLEEPEFWMHGGWSPAFRKEWRQFYGEPWQPPDSSYEACWRAARLRKELYRRCLTTVCNFVKKRRPDWGCTVATHSLFHYANIGIASPESALATIEACDTVIAQVWTDTIVFPCKYEGQTGPFPFAMAYLEFAQMTGMITPTGMSLVFLADPASDDPNRSWDVCRMCYEHTVAAGLQCGKVTRFEVMPWPDRVFGQLRYENEAADEQTTIPSGYATSLLAVVNALRTIPASPANRYIGVGVSDSLMYQRGRVGGTTGNFDALYGLTIPLIQRGVLPVLVQLEHLAPPVRARTLDGVRLFLLTYNGQKPPSPEVHAALAEWVRGGGVLVFFSDGNDPFARVPEWWNDGGAKQALPREDLFVRLGLQADPDPGRHKVGQGWLYYEARSPAEFAQAGGGKALMKRLRDAFARAGLTYPTERNWTAIYRGPYLAASAWDDGNGGEGFRRNGRFINLFDDALRFSETAYCPPGRSGLWLDLARVPEKPGVLASASRVTGWRVRDRRASYVSRGPKGTTCVTWVRLSGRPAGLSAMTHAGRPVPVKYWWNAKARAVKLVHENRTEGVWVYLQW